MADAKKAKTSTFAQRKASREKLKNVAPKFLKYVGEGASIREACIMSGVARSTVDNWLKIAEFNLDASYELITFYFNFADAKEKAAIAQFKKSVGGKTTTKRGPNGEVLWSVTTINNEKIAEKQEAKAKLDEQDNNEDQDSWTVEVESGIIEYGKDDNSLQKDSEDS